MQQNKENTFFEYEIGNEKLPCIIFIHGDLQNHTSFNKIIEFFRNKEHSTFVLDLPGHGLTKYSEQSKNLESFLQDLLTKNSISKPIIVGHSSGGIIAVNHLLKTNNASSLILINSPIINPLEINKSLSTQIDFFKNLSKQSFEKQELIDYSKISEDEIRKIGLKTTDPRGFSNNVDFYTQLPFDKNILEAKIPFLLINSAEDKLIPINEIKSLIGKIQNAKLIEINESHNSIIINPELINKIIDENYEFILTRDTRKTENLD